MTRRPVTRGRRGSDRALLTTLVLVVVVVALVSSLGAPLVPEIAESRHVSAATAQWTLTVALLSGSIATPVLGRLGDGPRRREVILVTLAAVAVGCVLAAPTLPFGVLLAGRALQGLGLGLMPLTVAVARDHLPERAVRRAVTLLSITTVAGAGIGYPISGALSAVGGVSASYWFGAVVATGSLALAASVLPDGGHLSRGRLDVVGAVLLGGGVGAALLAISQGGAWGWTSRPVLALGLGALLLLSTWTAHELRTATPLVELRLLRRRAVLLADVTAVAAGTGVYLLMSTVSWLLQSPDIGPGSGFGRAALLASCAMVPFSVLGVVTSQVAPRLLARHDDRWMMPIGCLLFALAMLVLATARLHEAVVFVVMALGGMGAGCTFSAMPSIVVAAVPRREVGSAMGFNQVLRTIGYSTGSAASAAVLAAHVDAVSGATTAAGFDTAAYVGGAVFLLAAVLSVLLGFAPRRRRRTPRVGDALLSPPEP